MRDRPSKRPTGPSARRREHGFVITLEFLVVMAIFVLPLVIGGVLLGRKMLTLYLNQHEYADQPNSQGTVWDSTATPRVVGPVVGFDPFEAPLILFRDDATKAAVILGVRRDRFTSYGHVFYTDDACSQNPRVRAWNASAATPGAGYPPIGFAYQDQARSYAVGNGNVLYQSGTPTGIDVMSTGADPLYVWESQSLIPSAGGPPTPPCFLVADGVMIYNLVDAAVVIDLDGPGNYTPPFRLAYPTPIPGPALPAPFGEED